MEEVTLDSLANSFAENSDNLSLEELAGCALINLQSPNVKRLAELNPLLGIAWAQAVGLCKIIEEMSESD